MEALCPLGAPAADQGTEEGREWCLYNYMLKFFFTEAGQSGSGISSRVMRLLYTCTTQKPSSSLQSGFSQVRERESPPVKFKKSRKIASKQMLSLGLLRQIWSCGFCPAPGEGDGKRRVLHQHLPARGLPGLDFTPSKQRRSRPAAPPRQGECQHRHRLSGLPGSARLVTHTHLFPSQ